MQSPNGQQPVTKKSSPISGLPFMRKNSPPRAPIEKKNSPPKNALEKKNSPMLKLFVYRNVLRGNSDYGYAQAAAYSEEEAIQILVKIFEEDQKIITELKQLYWNSLYRKNGINCHSPTAVLDLINATKKSWPVLLDEAPSTTCKLNNCKISSSEKFISSLKKGICDVHELGEHDDVFVKGMLYYKKNYFKGGC